MANYIKVQPDVYVEISPLLLLLSEQRYTRVLLRNALVTQFNLYIQIFVFVFVIVHNFFYPHFPIRIRHPQVSGPRFADTSFASRFFGAVYLA